MMSDTGLYLNWNPTWPREQPGRGATINLNGATAVLAGAHAAGTRGVNPSLDPDKKERERREGMMAQWESDYERDLQEYNLIEDMKYHCMFFPHLVVWYYGGD
jgi:hypothetical protein